MLKRFLSGTTDAVGVVILLGLLGFFGPKLWDIFVAWRQGLPDPKNGLDRGYVKARPEGAQIGQAFQMPGLLANGQESQDTATLKEAKLIVAVGESDGFWMPCSCTEGAASHLFAEPEATSAKLALLARPIDGKAVRTNKIMVYNSPFELVLLKSIVDEKFNLKPEDKNKPIRSGFTRFHPLGEGIGPRQAYFIRAKSGRWRVGSWVEGSQKAWVVGNGDYGEPGSERPKFDDVVEEDVSSAEVEILIKPK